LIGASIEEPTSYFDAAGVGYLQTLYAAYHSPSVCGLTGPDPTVLVQEQVAGTRRLYQGVNLNGRFELSPYIAILPSYSINLAILEAASARLNDGPTTTIVGAQLPNRPIHKGNLAIDGLIPRPGIELLANAQYVGANNQQNLGPYVSMSFGISHRFGPGQLTLFENNAFNTYAGVFSSDVDARPLPLSNGEQLLTAGTPLLPRTIFLSYAVAIGGPAPGPAFKQFSRARVAQAQPTPEPSPSGAPRRPQRFVSNPPPPGTDPLSLATSRDTCDATQQPLATPVFEQLHAYVAAYEKGDKTPDVTGFNVTPHKTAAGSAVAYFLEIRPNFPRPPGAAQDAGRGGRSGGGGGFGRGGGGFPGGGPGGGPGEGGPGGGEGAGPPPPGDQVNANSAAPAAPTPEQQAARRNFQNSPAVKAFRAFIGCAYVTILSQSDAKAKGIALDGGRPGLIYVPGIGMTFVQETQLPQGGGSLKNGT
jgi:hypothetical protein